MTEKIGLEAVLELKSFQTAMKTYIGSINQMNTQTTAAANQISTKLAGVGGSFNKISQSATSASNSVVSRMVSLGGSIGKVGLIAGGVALAGVAALTGGILLLGSTALTEFAKYERMVLSIQSLVAREISQGTLVEQSRTVLASLTKKEADELSGLAQKIKDEELARSTLKARIMEQSEALRQLREAHGEDALDVQTATARLAELENEYNKAGTEINTMKDRVVELNNKSGELVTVLDKVRTGQMDMTTAMEQAGPRAQELVNWISKLAVLSPFTEAGIQDAFQTALAYGFTTDQAKRLTEAEVDYTAATGKGIHVTNLIALALGQIQAKGKVSGQELIQLTNAGIGVNKILEDMGFTLDDVSNGLVDADTFIEAVIKDMEIFKGAGAAQSETFSGLISTLSDLKAIGLREFFTGTFTAIQPYLADFVGGMVSAALETGRIREIGDVVGGVVAQGLKVASEFAGILVKRIGRVTRAFQNFGIRGAAVSIVSQLGLDHATIMPAVDGVLDAFGRIQRAFDNFGIRGAAVSIMSLLGLEPVQIGGVFTTIDTVKQKVNELIGSFQTGGILGEGGLLTALGLSPETVTTVQGVIEAIGEVISGISFSELTGAIAGIGTILAGGVIVGAITGIGVAIAGLLTPLNLLIAGAAVLGAAWAGNWGNIQGIVQQAADFITQEWGTMASAVSAMTLGAMLGLDPESTAQILLGANAVIATLTSLGDWWVTNWPVMQAVALTAWTVIQGIFAGFQNVGLVASAQLQQAFTNITQGLANLGLNWTDVWNALKTATGIVLAGIGVILLGAVSAVGGLVVAVTSAISTMTSVWAAGAAQVTTLITGVTTMLVGVGQIWTGILTGDWSMAWQGYVLVFQGAIETIKGMLGVLVTLFAGPFAIIYSIIEGFVTGVVAVFTGLYDTLVGNSIVPDLINGITNWFKRLPQMVGTALSGLAEAVGKPFENVQEIAQKAFDPEFWGQLGTDAINGLLEGMKAKAGDVLEFLKGLAKDSLTGLGQFWGAQSPARKFIPLGESVPQGVALGIDRATSLVGSAVTGLGDLVSKMLTASITSSQGGGNLFGDMLNFGDEGHLKSRGFSDTRARNVKAAYRSALTELWDEITAGTAGALDLEALTKKNAGDWGQFVEGADIAFGTVVERIRTAGAEMAEVARREIMDKMLNMASGFASFGDFLTDMLTTQRAAVTETIDSISKLAAENLKLGESLTTQEQKLAILNQELVELTAQENQDTIAIDKKRMAIAALTKEIDTNRAAMEANQAAMQASQKALEQMAFDEGAKGEEARIKLLQDFLESKGKELVINKELTDEEKARGITAYHLTYDRKAAQAELNELLRKQREEQEAIAALEKSKADLAFLQQQVAILQLIKDNGLKVGDIFKDGIKFGLGASASDLMTATSAVIEAMISQINDDLQVASPSKRLTRIFKYAMEGAAIGIEKGQSMLSSAVKATPLLQAVVNPQMVRQPISGRAGNNTTNNYNFPMTVSTAATAEGVVRQYEVKKSMYAAA